MAAEPPPWLPRYDLHIKMDTAQRLVTVRERVTWVNRHYRPARELIFNAHAHYDIPSKDIGLLAKTVEERYQTEKRVWRLFTAGDRSLRSGMMYLQFRAALISGKVLRADA